MTKLKDKRIEKGLTPAQLADAAGVSRPYIHDLELGARGAKPDTWERIAAVLGCDVDEIEKRKWYEADGGD